MGARVELPLVEHELMQSLSPDQVEQLSGAMERLTLVVLEDRP